MKSDTLSHHPFGVHYVASRQSLQQSHRGCLYVKAGVLLDDLCAPDAAPPSLFAAPSARAAKLMEAMDGLNGRFGRNAVFPAAMGVDTGGGRGWKLKAERHSPRYTTRLEDLPRVT